MPQAANLPIKAITVHCSATSPAVNVTASMIDRWHRAKGWLKIGYHYVIRRDGVIDKGREDTEVGAHVEGFNTGNLGICMAGGVDDKGVPAQNFTDDQYHTLAILLQDLKKKHPNAEIKGHRDWPNVKKACPSFDVRKWIKDTGVNV